MRRVIEKETLRLGSISKVQIEFYNKRAQMPKMGLEKGILFQTHCLGDEWCNSDRPITRIEIRLGRDALKCLGVNTFSDLKERERAIVELITHDWFRILEKPKVRGCENTAAIHPVWLRVCELFRSYFSGADVDVKWEKNQSVSCDPVALERQALGCISKALGARFGEQENRQLSVELLTGWGERVQNELHEKINSYAEHVRIKTGIKLGLPFDGDDKAELDYMEGIGKQKIEAFMAQFQGIDNPELRLRR